MMVARSAVHEILAGIGFLIGTVCMCTSALLESQTKQTKAIREAGEDHWRINSAMYQHMRFPEKTVGTPVRKSDELE